MSIRPIFLWKALVLGVAMLATGCMSPRFEPVDHALLETIRFQSETVDIAADPLALSPTDSIRLDESISPGSAASIIKEVLITGNQTLPEHRILRQIRTRPGRYFDPDVLQQDVDQLWQMKSIRRVNGPYVDQQSDGVIITIDIVERLYIDEVRFVGNRGITDRQLKQETGLRGGQPLDLQAVRMAKHRIEDFYREKGYPKTQVTIMEGDQIEDRKVIFLIHEDNLQRVWNVSFEGNTIASDARLKNFIKMKPGILWLVGGKVNRREIKQDILRLTSYYRSLGFFNAKIGRELIENDSGSWLTIRYVINEGPRYRVRSVAFVGNEKYSTEQLMSIVKLKPSDGEAPEFNSAKMNSDVTSLIDLYGSQGYVAADVQAEPRFLETPGVLDLVYKIQEGKQYRVGNINVLIDGDYGVTQWQVVMNRIGLRPGDLLDTRKLRNSESRLLRAQLFADGSPSAPGNPPRIVVRPPDLDDFEPGRLIR